MRGNPKHMHERGMPRHGFSQNLGGPRGSCNSLNTIQSCAKGGHGSGRKHGPHPYGSKGKPVGPYGHMNRPISNQPGFYGNQYIANPLEGNLHGGEAGFGGNRGAKGPRNDDIYYNNNDPYFDNAGFRGQE